MEARAAGLVVVGTATGSSREILGNEVNGLAFPGGDAHECAKCIESLCRRPSLVESLRRSGKITEANAFRFEDTVTAIEEYLESVGN